MSNNRIHFGTLEHLANQTEAEKQLSENSDNEIDFDELGCYLYVLFVFNTNTIDENGNSDTEYTENQFQAKEEQSILLKEFERKDLARKLAVPTDDGKVRLRLRELQEPTCLFGEGPGDRRDRLRYLLSKIELEKSSTSATNDNTADNNLIEDESENKSIDQTNEKQLEEFYTEGSQNLLNARKNIALFSLPRYEKLPLFKI
ncbi:U4/U6 small nuclear ribonucleoprotein Prp4 [Smittium culicis]|uniref:U4/U6 small nuclear ribonucleoprotein Prp4 n=1 Tax=Smittium culicis TaxID=133412 RepID=A0A1R1XGF4_9FUNG|nr:U4/U6 small nuclear ribonucleoprotein Prp4 [Smittium culicis]